MSNPASNPGWITWGEARKAARAAAVDDETRQKRRHQAISLATKGYYVFPVLITVDADGKNRKQYVTARARKGDRNTPGWGATTDLDTVRDWWAEGSDFGGCMVGINTEWSGIVVVDLDVKNGHDGVAEWAKLCPEPYPLPAYVAHTSSGGRHYFYRADPDRPVQNTAGIENEDGSLSGVADGVDTRAVGGMVVAWGGALPAPSALPPVPEIVHQRVPLVPKGSSPAPGVQKAGPSPWEEFVPAPAGEQEVVERVRELAGELAGLRGRVYDWLSTEAPKVGNYVAAGQIEQAQAERIMLAAFDGWTWSSAADASQYRGILLDQIRFGMQNARPWRETQHEAQDGAPVESPDDDDDSLPSWAEVDLSCFVTGEYEAPRPELMPRGDGACLLYRGLVHSIHGESESGKSWVAQCEVARIIKADGTAAYIDFESDPASIVGRLLELGCTPEQIMARLSYRRPESSPSATKEFAAWEALFADARDIAVIDGVTDSLGLWGASSQDNDEVAGWLRAFPRRLARRTGAAVVLIDHVVKNTESRGRFAMGAQSKMAGLDGAAYTVDVVEPLGRGLRGVLSLRVAKDRPGGVRGIAGEMKKGDRTQEVALFVLDGTSGSLVASLDAPDGARKAFRPTHLMERISVYVETNPGCPKSAIERDVTGNKPAKATALSLLIAEGWIKVEPVGKALRLHSLTRFREVDFPTSPMSPNLPQTSPMGEAPTISPTSPIPLLRGEVGSGGGSRGVQEAITPTATSPRCLCPNGRWGEHRTGCPVAEVA